MSGYSDIIPVIKSLKFRGLNLELRLVDGRIISVPLNKFPAIKKLTPSQRKKYSIIGGVGIDFEDSDEVFHISEFLGVNNSQSSLEKKIKPYAAASHALSYVAEPTIKYKKKK